MAFEQSSSGKTHAILEECGRPHRRGHWIDHNNPGIYFQTLNQLLTVVQHHSECYQESFSVAILEFVGESLCILCASTLAALIYSKA